jgi:autotransporter-associated beta strand protein
VRRGAGTLVLDGSASNTYTGTTNIFDGVTVLSKTGGAVAISGPVTMGAGDSLQPYLRTTQNNQFDD